MIYPGQDLKFKIETTFDDFLLTEDDFEIAIKDRYGRQRNLIKKEDCFYDSEGNFYFVVENVPRGVFYAYFKGSYEDDDYDKQKRVVCDQQLLFVCGECPCKNPCKCEHKVTYTQVWTVSIDGEDYRADCDGRYILTSDDKRICFKSDKQKEIDDMGKVRMSMTGEEFLRKWEGTNPNGEIDTVPEMMNAMQGIRDDETIQEEINEKTEEAEVDRVTPEELDKFKV